MLDSAPHAAAADEMVLSLLNGALGVRLPDHEVWVQAYEADPGTKILLSFVHNPSLITIKSILNVHFIYRHSVWNGLIYEQNRILFLQELFANDDYCVRLQFVP